MITKERLKEKSIELDIPFKNLLSAVVCEGILEIISQGKYCNELYLCYVDGFTEDNYRKNPVTEIYFEYERDLDEKMAYLYMRDILKHLIANGASHGFSIEGQVEEGKISLKIYLKEMYVLINLFMSKHIGKTDKDYVEIKQVAYENRVIKILVNSKEEELCQHLIEILTKLELINDMDHYYYLYLILQKYPINGRKVHDRLKELLEENRIVADEKRLKTIGSYRDYTYLKKKWKVELRQKKVSEPQWSDTVDCLYGFLGPIWNSLIKEVVFLGDWMPGLKRFLD
ncbi:MAG: hypothetical protein K5773_09600 [Pseudobutyrivibrio sp.]|nr:hypothetical protein [Pseudobutyrivibrio sp.]